MAADARRMKVNVHCRPPQHAKDSAAKVVLVPPHATVHTLKSLLLEEAGVPPAQQRLVCCGVVLAPDTASLLDVAPAGETLWLVDQSPVDAAWTFEGKTRSMFSLGDDMVGDVQCAGDDFAALFQEFVDSAAWTLRADGAGMAALTQAVRALATPEASDAPFGGGPHPDLDGEPHVTWFADYGCALIADIARPGVSRGRHCHPRLP
jgi:hypothetical protein